MKERLNTFLTWCKENKMKASTALSMALLFVMGITANAETATGNIDSSMTTALTTGFAAVKTDVTTIISTALPYALGIMGIMIAIMIGVRFFKRASK